MTKQLAERSESDRQKIVPEWGVAADDQIVLVAFLALLLILGAFGWNTWRSDGDAVSATAGPTVTANGDAPTASGRVDLSDVESTYHIHGRMKGDVAVLTGTVADAATRDAASEAAQAVEGVDRVDNRLRLSSEGTAADQEAEGSGQVSSQVTTTTTAAPTSTPPVVAAATVDASSDSIVLSGSVPDEATAATLRAAAAEAYTADQIDDRLVIEDEASSFELVLTGTVGSAEALDALGDSISAVGADRYDESIELDSAVAVSAALNELFELEPILFETGSNTILAASLPTLDRAAEILADHPDAVVEIGGHTDSRGSAESNLTLSQARADAVLEALTERGVTNDMSTIGYGETRLLIDPDNTPESQQANRRIEFTPN